MTSVTCDLTISVDGFVAGPNPLGAEACFSWFVDRSSEGDNHRS